MIKTALFAAAAAIATIATAAPALAKDVPVFYGDLDLASAPGQSTFAKRIHTAARKACDMDGSRALPTRAALDCYKQAHATARTRMASLIEDTRLGG